MSQLGHQRRSALITVADKCLLYSETDRIAAWPRNDAKLPIGDIAALYSVTSSASTSKLCGTANPSAFAVFRLITKSNPSKGALRVRAFRDRQKPARILGDEEFTQQVEDWMFRHYPCETEAMFKRVEKEFVTLLQTTPKDSFVRKSGIAVPEESLPDVAEPTTKGLAVRLATEFYKLVRWAADAQAVHEAQGQGVGRLGTRRRPQRRSRASR
jgi:hypothetical protein